MASTNREDDLLRAEPLHVEGAPTMTKDTENPNPGKRIIEEHLQDGIKVDNKQKFRHRSPGKDNYDVQHIEGDDIERMTGRWHRIRWVIDRIAKRYQKRIIDGETGEVLRDEDKPLSEHRGHGSARKK